MLRCASFYGLMEDMQEPGPCGRPLLHVAALALTMGMQPLPALSCQTALLLAVDVSNSVDGREYMIQSRGIAAALRDPVIAETLVQGQSAIAVLQWSGRNMQSLAVPWTRVTSPATLAALAATIEAMPRLHLGGNTALGDALTVALDSFGGMQDCARWIVDVSGDGADNADTNVAVARRLAERRGITVNGLAIESMGLAITGYYENNLVTRDGFVETARGFADFARAIRAKIRRELSRLTG
jgi:Ca-activated chloride channel family protein